MAYLSIWLDVCTKCTEEKVASSKLTIIEIPFLYVNNTGRIYVIL